MPTKLTTKAVERSTFVIAASFSDESEAAVVPSTLTWTLTDRLGNVVNSRSQVSITPATSVNVVLTDEDLALSTALEGRVRLVTFEGTYNSDLGSGLAIRDQVEFEIQPLVAVT